jgi:methionine-rich copper-binding protein CopC
MKTLILAFCFSCAAGPVLAHAFLQHADPGAGAQLNAAPKTLTLVFSEKLEPVFSGVSVTDGAGHDMEASQAKISDASMMVALKPLAPGSYRVSWHVVSLDTHRTEGSYKFKVGP